MNRREWLRKAIACFQRQTFQSKELLIVNEGAPVEDLAAGLPDVRIVQIRNRLTTGAKRNLCCELARGQVIVHWDDDDWSHPERIAEQVELLRKGAQVTGYHSLPFHGPADEAWLYSNHAHYALGTSLAYWRSWWAANRFPDHQVGEDTAFVNRAAAVIVATDGRKRMVATTHPQNTSPRTYRGKQWQRISAAEFPPEYQTEVLSCFA